VKAWHEVGSLADVDREGRILIRIEGREIGVVRMRIEDGRVLVQA
jgi:hypothetical protein